MQSILKWRLVWGAILITAYRLLPTHTIGDFDKGNYGTFHCMLGRVIGLDAHGVPSALHGLHVQHFGYTGFKYGAHIAEQAFIIG
jgi:hypothetical protein